MLYLASMNGIKNGLNDTGIGIGQSQLMIMYDGDGITIFKT
jgi:hypothetical protein